MTNPQFFSISDNSFHKRGFPWIQTLGAGFRQVYLCNRCAPTRSIMYADGPVEAFLESDKGVRWPDVIGCGHFPFLILSARAVRAFSAEGIGEFPHHPVLIQPPLPRRLAGPEPELLRYVWLDGKKMRGALLDFETSGFVDVQFCPECGTRTDDISATFDRQRSCACPYAFRPGTWNGSNLFTTDLSECSFFCTEAVVDCAHKHKLTNFRFIPAEQGANPASNGIDYLRKRPSHRLQPPRGGRAGGGDGSMRRRSRLSGHR